ncbi:MAG: hypothetical protein IPG99_08125 [Ignavibacteria bacterium]|nr:hypothetical protein [Ignavibacteria bacterium]
MIFSGCNNKKETTSSVALNGGIKGGGVYRINELENIRSLDPVGINDVVSHHVAHQIYDLLVDLDTNLNLIPQLATRWEISEDGLLYIPFKKRSEVSGQRLLPGWQGKEFNANDVKYSLDRVCDPRTGTLDLTIIRIMLKAQKNISMKFQRRERKTGSQRSMVYPGT